VDFLLDVFLHLDQHLNEWAGTLGPWLYLVLFVVVFCETGLVATPFLPGDSLLFAVGALASIDGSPIRLELMVVTLIAAALCGDLTNYTIGRYIGPRIFSSESSWLFRREHLKRTQEFYVRHGRKTIVIARFVPIVRTFAPFVAGIGQMEFRRFASFSVGGAIGWVVSLSLAGYYFGQIPVVKNNFEAVILVIIAISVMPIFVEWLRARGAAQAG
jgi:membrane-associated protein